MNRFKTFTLLQLILTLATTSIYCSKKREYNENIANFIEKHKIEKQTTKKRYKECQITKSVITKLKKKFDENPVNPGGCKNYLEQKESILTIPESPLFLPEEENFEKFFENHEEPEEQTNIDFLRAHYNEYNPSHPSPMKEFEISQFLEVFGKPSQTEEEYKPEEYGVEIGSPYKGRDYGSPFSTQPIFDDKSENNEEELFGLGTPNSYYKNI